MGPFYALDGFKMGKLDVHLFRNDCIAVLNEVRNTLEMFFEKLSRGCISNNMGCLVLDNRLKESIRLEATSS